MTILFDIPPKPAIVLPAPKNLMQLRLPEGWLNKRGLLVPEVRRSHFVVTPLIGFMAGSGVIPILTFQAHQEEGANQTTYTWTNMAIGDPTPDRLIIVVAFAHDSADTAGEAPNTITVAGVTATLHVSIAGTGTNEGSIAIGTALVPTGTTATIVVTYPGARVRAGIGVYSLTNYGNSIPVQTDSEAATVDGTTISVDLTVGTFSVAVIGATSRQATPSGITWTNATEDYDVALELSESNHSCSRPTPGVGATTITATWANTGSPVIAGAVWSG